MEGPTDLVFSTTSIHGLQQIGRKGSVLRPLWWGCAFVASIALMSLHCSQVTNKLLSYPKDVVQQVFGGILTFPADTICSLGLVKRSAVAKIPTFMAMESALKAVGTASATTSSTSVGGGVSTVLGQQAITTSSAAITSVAAALCQQSCTYWEPFCFIYTPSHGIYGPSGSLCHYGGSLLNFPSTNYTTYERFRAQNFSTYFWMDYTNLNGHNSSYPGIWTDTLGRSAPSNFLDWWQPNWPSGDVGFSTLIVYVDLSTTPAAIRFRDCSTACEVNIICTCQCPAVQPPLNGYIVGDSYTDLTMSVLFGCNSGYFLIGSPIMTCSHVGTGVNWNVPPPQCLANCTAMVSQMFLIIYNTIDNSTTSGTLATFTYPNGFTLVGRNDATCFNGTWDLVTADYPICLGISNVNESQFLDFAGHNPKPNTLSAAATFYGLLPYILSSLTDAQMETIGFNETNIMVSCTFNQRDCAKFAIASRRDSLNGMCYTFNHMNMSQYYTVSRSGETTGLKLLLFSLQGEYLSIVTSGGLKMFVHDQNDPIFYGHNGFMLSPGLTYSIALQKAMEILLNTPNDLCVEDAQQVQFYNFNNSTYFQEACISSYIQTQIVLNCSCNSPTLPAKDSKIPVCGVVQQSCVQQVYNDSDTLVSSAKLFCPPRCRTSTSWQSKATVAATTKLNISKEEYLRNTVDVSMFFQTLDVVNLVEVASYTVINLLSDLGATMGVLVGMSVISWVEFLYATCQCGKVLLQKSLRKFA